MAHFFMGKLPVSVGAIVSCTYNSMYGFIWFEKVRKRRKEELLNSFLWVKLHKKSVMGVDGNHSTVLMSGYTSGGLFGFEQARKTKDCACKIQESDESSVICHLFWWQESFIWKLQRVEFWH